MMQTSFRKSTKGVSDFQRIPGTQRSVHNGQLLCSTGVPSLDSIVGGGIPVGSVMMVEEDSNDQYANLMTRYFVAEGIVSGNAILTISQDTIESQINSLPEPVPQSRKPHLPHERMKIAWRYQSLPQMDASYGQPLDYGHHYDINTPINLSRLKNCQYHSINLTEAFLEETVTEQDTPKYILKKMYQHMLDNNFITKSSDTARGPSKVLRIAIPNFGSPFWGKLLESDIIQFLFCLRAIVRDSLAVCIISTPAHIHNTNTVQLMRHHVDCVISLKDFGQDKTNPLYKEYHGLLKIYKLPSVNTLLPYMPDTLDLAFKLRRKKFSIERLHLPPDIDTSSQQKGTLDNTKATASHISSLDF